MRALHFLFLPVFLWGCTKAPQGLKTEFTDDFEAYSSVSDLIAPDSSAWTGINLNEINTSTEPLRIDTVIVHSGKRSVRFHCKQKDAEKKEVCKCNLNKDGLFFKQGDVVYYSAWYYIERSDSDYGTFFVWDLEEIVNGSTGIRVMAWEENLELERGKIGLSNIFQKEPVTLFPVNRWTRLELEVKLSQYRAGHVRMWLDGKELLYRDHIRTLPKDAINLGWGTKGYYERLQSGITAKGGTEELVLYLDDMVIKKK